MEISELDWKLYRKKIVIWQNSFMEKLCNEYVAFLSDCNIKPSDKFCDLEHRIRKDKHLAGVVVEMKRSNMIYDIARLIDEKAISIDDISEFSTDTQDMVKLLLNYKP